MWANLQMDPSKVFRIVNVTWAALQEDTSARRTEDAKRKEKEKRFRLGGKDSSRNNQTPPLVVRS